MSLQLAPLFNSRKPVSRWGVAFIVLAFCIFVGAYYLRLPFGEDEYPSAKPFVIAAAIFFAVMLWQHYRSSSSPSPLVRIASALLLAGFETLVLACLNIVIIVALAGMDAGPEPRKPLPGNLLQIVNSADEITLYAALGLSHDDNATLAQLATPKYYVSDVKYGGEMVNDEAVLGHTELGFVGKILARRLLRQMSNGGGHACIMFPHHVLRLKASGHIYAVNICYQCGMVIVFEGHKRIADLDTTKFPKLLFDALLWLANVPIDFSDLTPAQVQAIGARHHELLAIQARKDVAAGLRWAAFTPASLRKLVESGIKLPLTEQQKTLYSDALEKAYPDQNKRLLVLLDWLGTDSGSWSFSGNPRSPLYDKIGLVIALLEKTRREEIIAAFESHPLTPQQMEGAVRALTLHRFDASAYSKPELPAALRKSLMAHVIRDSDPDNEGNAYVDLADE